MIMNYKKPIVFAATAAALLVVGATVAFAADAKVDTNDDTLVQITDSSVSDVTISSVTSEPGTSEPTTSEQNTPVENTTSETVISTIETYRIPILDSYDGSCFGYVETNENGNKVPYFIPFDRLNEPGYVYGCLSHDDEYAVIGKFELSWSEIEGFSDVLEKLPIKESVLRVYSIEETNNMTLEYKLKFGYEHYTDWGSNMAMGLFDENQNLVMRHFPTAIKVYPHIKDENSYTHEEIIDGAILRW